MNDSPLISLVIPTRERADTLRYTLRTATEQEEPDCEIVVCDNASTDETRSVVASAASTDPRIRYVNAGQRLPMTANWNFALRHVRGRYVIIIGDDDGVMPGGLARLRRLIERRPAPIYFWQTSEYFWPIEQVPPRITHVAPLSEPREVQLAPLAKFAVRWGTWRYGALPLVYHAAVARALLDKLLARTGTVFQSTNPDVFMAFALPALCDRAIDSGESFTVSGRSSKANGGSTIATDGEAIFERFVEEYGDYSLHPTLDLMIPFKVNMYADSALKAMDLFPEFYRDTPFNYSALYAHTHRIIRSPSIRQLLSMRERLRAKQPFSGARFLALCAVHQMLAFRVSVRERVIRHRHAPLSTEMPQNIHAMVHYLARVQPRAA